MTEQEIREKWEALHNTLQLSYYQPLGKFADQDPPTPAEILVLENVMGESCTGLDQVNFDRIHGALWAVCEQEFIDNGYSEELPE